MGYEIKNTSMRDLAISSLVDYPMESKIFYIKIFARIKTTCVMVLKCFK